MNLYDNLPNSRGEMQEKCKLWMVVGRVIGVSQGGWQRVVVGAILSRVDRQKGGEWGEPVTLEKAQQHNRVDTDGYDISEVSGHLRFSYNSSFCPQQRSGSFDDPPPLPSYLLFRFDFSAGLVPLIISFCSSTGHVSLRLSFSVVGFSSAFFACILFCPLSLSLSLFESCFYFPSSTFLPPLFPSSARRNSAQRGAPLSSFAFVAKPINESFLFKFDSGVLLYHPNLKKYNVSYLWNIWTKVVNRSFWLFLWLGGSSAKMGNYFRER